MRCAAVFIALSLCAAPAFAQSTAVQVPPQLTDPATADRLADAIQGLSQALLDLKIGGMQAALEGRQPTATERTLTVPISAGETTRGSIGTSSSRSRKRSR